MRIAIVGGAGTLGRRTAEELSTRGHEIRVLGRSAPKYRVDLTTGEGLASALEGCDVVIDASNNSSKKAAETLVEGSRRLLAAERTAGVGHHVCVSIVGCEHVPMGYFRVKTAQESVVQHGSVPWTIVRATQFHELVATTLTALAKWRVVPMPRAVLQNVACAEVATAVADAALQAPRRDRIDVVGPETVQARDLIRDWRSSTGRRVLLVPLPMPGKAGRALRTGALTTDNPDVRGTVTFKNWLRDGALQNH